MASVSLACDDVIMMQVDISVIEKAVDCLRILTTGNEANKVALLTSASGLPCLVRLMESSPDQVICRTPLGAVPLLYVTVSRNVHNNVLRLSMSVLHLTLCMAVSQTSMFCV
jgi:hypothetical protein